MGAKINHRWFNGGTNRIKNTKRKMCRSLNLRIKGEGGQHRVNETKCLRRKDERSVQGLEKGCGRSPRPKENLQEVIRMESGRASLVTVKHRLRDDAVSPTVAPTGIDGSRGGRFGIGGGRGGGGGEVRDEGIHLVNLKEAPDVAWSV
ncbi:hypothetical protein BJV74DRAFT_796489 [Russula compacta]|nr:hypothetical protein BJV74DRAFT_796489 [Russula compacta]